MIRDAIPLTILGDFAILAAMVDEENVFVASRVSDGMALTVWSPNPEQSNTEMVYQTYDTATSWSTVPNATFSWSTRAQLMSIAVAARGEEYPRVAIAVNFDTEFRVLIYNGMRFRNNNLFF